MSRAPIKPTLKVTAIPEERNALPRDFFIPPPPEMLPRELELAERNVSFKASALSAPASTSLNEVTMAVQQAMFRAQS